MHTHVHTWYSRLFDCFECDNTYFVSVGDALPLSRIQDICPRTVGPAIAGGPKVNMSASNVTAALDKRCMMASTLFLVKRKPSSLRYMNVVLGTAVADEPSERFPADRWRRPPEALVAKRSQS